jgi:DNA-binding NtrC family response regulator
MTSTEAILVVDDEAIILMSIKRALRMEFSDTYLYEVALNAELGLKAIERLSAEGIKVVLLISDWLMPGMKGDEFLSIVHGRFPEIRLILLSGHIEDAEMERVRKDVDLLAFIRKPWDIERLLGIVRDALT